MYRFIVAGDNNSQITTLNQSVSHDYSENKDYIIETSNIKQIPEMSFKDNKDITSLELSSQLSLFSDVKGVICTIEPFSFQNCLNLTTVNLTNIQELYICSYAFYNCSQLNNVYINNGLKYIGVSAFEKCTSLTEATIPNTIEVISDKAFYNTGLNKIKFLGSQDEWQNVLKGKNWTNGEITIEYT